MMNSIRSALVGYGSVAEKMHAPLIDCNPDLDFVAVVERNGLRCQQKYPTISTFKSLDDLIEADAADLIVITTPNEFHFSMAKKCLLAGKHVVVDKPVTIFAHEAEELMEIAKSKNRICSVFQNRRFDGDILTLQQLIQENLLGELVYLESHFDRFRPDLTENWREKEVPGNGITYDLGTHLIDQVVLLFGNPEAVQADILKQRTGAVADDYFDIVLYYPKFKARLTAGVLVNAPTPRFLLLGKKGSYQKFGLDVQEQAFKNGQRPEGEYWGVEASSGWGKVHIGTEIIPYPTVNGDYRIFYQNIADSILKGAPLKVTLEEAIRVIKLVEATFLSSRSGRKIEREEGNW